MKLYMAARTWGGTRFMLRVELTGSYARTGDQIQMVEVQARTGLTGQSSARAAMDGGPEAGLLYVEMGDIRDETGSALQWTPQEWRDALEAALAARGSR